MSKIILCQHCEVISALGLRCVLHHHSGLQIDKSCIFMTKLCYVHLRVKNERPVRLKYTALCSPQMDVPGTT